jgi:hypothetical protein
LLILILLTPPSIATGQGGAPAGRQVSPGCGLNGAAGARDGYRMQTGCSMSLEELAFRQQFAEAVLAGSPDVDEVIEEISYEQDQVAD